MDPVTIGALVTTATTAFKTVKKLVESGREIEDVAGQLGTWFTAMNDIKEARESAKKPSFFKKKLRQKSVEQEALDTMIAEKRMQDQEDQLRELIMWTYGETALRRMYAMRKEIRQKREAEVYSKKRAQKKMVEAAVVAAAIVICVCTVWWFFELITAYRASQ